MTCDWPLEEPLPDDWSTLDPGHQARGRTLASRTLERLCGYRVGYCPVTVRPCRVHSVNCPADHGYAAVGYPPVGVLNWGGTWSNTVTCTTSCRTRCEVELPAPVTRISQVKADGRILDAADYRVEGGNLLTWRGAGDCPFPATQDLDAPDTEPGTMSVTYVNAYDPGPVGAFACAVLAYEFALASAGMRCRLPDGVTAITRQGISMNVVSGAFPDGMTGIHEVDAFIGLWNPRGLTDPPQVWSPDLPSVRRIGG